MITLRSVSFRYPRDEADALRDVTLTLAAGETIAIVGLSGSGKTTLLNLMGLLWDEKLSSGTAWYTDADGKEHHYNELRLRGKASLRRREFGFVLQSSYMLQHFTCGDNVAMPLALQRVGRAQRKHRVAKLLARADPTRRLEGLIDRPAREVSGGECQRMAILRAVIHNPRVLFADEPLSNLDPKNAKHILRLLSDWKNGRFHATQHRSRTQVLVTHNMNLAFSQADQFVVLREGRIVGDQVWSKNQLLGPDDLERMMICGNG